jgi:hypothetical protein
MVNKQSNCKHMYNTFFKLCLVILAFIVISANTTKLALAQELNPKNGLGLDSNETVYQQNEKGSEDKEFSFEPKSGLMGEVNQKFHDDYERLISQTISTFGKPGGSSVLLFTQNKLITYHNGNKEEQNYLPPAYHQLKATDHYPISLYLTLQPIEGQKLTNSIKDYLINSSKLLQENLNNLDNKTLPENIIEAQRAVFTESIKYIDQVLSQGRVDSDKLNQYVRLMSPKMVENVNLAAAAELSSLNEIIKNLLTKDKWESLYVVVGGVHQSRNRELVTQYFDHVFNEPQGPGAELENRVIYLESTTGDESEAFSLLARHILDRKIAAAFFKDPMRLQTDALSDAADFWLWEHTMDIPKWP